MLISGSLFMNTLAFSLTPSEKDQTIKDLKCFVTSSCEIRKMAKELAQEIVDLPKNEKEFQKLGQDLSIELAKVTPQDINTQNINELNQEIERALLERNLSINQNLKRDKITGAVVGGVIGFAISYRFTRGLMSEERVIRNVARLMSVVMTLAGAEVGEQVSYLAGKVLNKSELESGIDFLKK